MKGRYAGKENHFYGRTHTPEVKKAISENTKQSAQNRGHGTFKGKRHTEEAKRKMSKSSKGLNVGSDHHNHYGYWITPWGKYPSIQQAINNCPKKVGFDAIRSWCLYNNNKPINRAGRKNSYMTRTEVGKTPKEIGFGFESILL